MAENGEIDLEAVSEYQLRDKFLPGAKVPCHVGASLDKPPEWLDREKFSRGQAFCRKYLASVFLSFFWTNVFGFAWNATFQVFLHQAKTDTIQKQWQRNTRMFRYMSKWFEGDIWDPSSAANRTMKNVHLLHHRSGLDTESKAEEVRNAKVDTSKEPQEWAKSKIWSAVRKDATRQENRPHVPPLVPPEDRCFISQLDIAISVITVLISVMVRPRAFGVHGASREDMESLLYLWRVIGYYLGLEDRFNPCDATLEEFQALCKEAMFGILHPGASTMTRENEYYARVCAKCLSRIPFMFFFNMEVLFLLGAKSFGMNIKDSYTAISFWSKVSYWICWLFLSVLMRSSLVLKFANYHIAKSLGEATN